MAIAKSWAHALTHLPKNPYCYSCIIAKMVKPHHRRRNAIPEHKLPKAFGDQITSDHLISKNDASVGYNGSKFAQVILDIHIVDHGVPTGQPQPL